MLSDIQITDLSKASGRFYVYVYRDPRKSNTPIYVGKGTENPKYGNFSRARFHWARKSSSRGLREILVELKRLGLEPVIEVIGRVDSEAEAFELEARLIARYGRRDLGLGDLCNVSDGGEGPTGHRHSEESRRKIGEASRRMHSDEELAARRAANISAALSRPTTRAARSEIMKEVHSRPGDQERRAASQRATFATAEHKARRSKATKESHATPETKAIHSASLRRRWAAPGAKQQQSAAMSALYDNPDHKAKQAAGVRAWFSSPEYAEKKLARQRAKLVEQAA